MKSQDFTMLPDCDYFCDACGRKVCRDVNPSPTEDERICGDCYDEHGPHGTCHCCERDEWAVPKRPGWQILESAEAKVRHLVVDFARTAQTTLAFASYRRDHIPAEVLAALGRARDAAVEARKAMTT